jgi:hypothetical protein
VKATFTVCYVTRSGTHAGMFRVVFIGDGGTSLVLDGITPDQAREFSRFDGLGQPHPSMTRFQLAAQPDTVPAV